jgi:hypothetical protein
LEISILKKKKNRKKGKNMRKKIALKTHIMWFLVVVVVGASVYLYMKHQNEDDDSEDEGDSKKKKKWNMEEVREIQVNLTQDPTDALKNVYAPPLRYQDMDYRQIGYLKNGHGRLPLFGRQIDRNDKWTYYTMDGGIKLPIEHDRRKCTQSPGCWSFSDHDKVTVDGAPFEVVLYDMKVIGY